MTTQMAINVERIKTDKAMAEAQAIRTKVFVEGQDVPPEIEFDGLDETTIHWIARSDDGKAIATLRLFDKGNGIGKVERVAVLDEYQGQGIGRILMEFMEADAKQQGFTHLTMHSQTHCQDFYLKLGYEITDPDVFYEADIPHVVMERDL